MKTIKELANDIAIRTGKILTDEYNNKYELVVSSSGHNCLLTVPNNKMHIINLSYNKEFDIDTDEIENIELTNYLDKQWEMIEQYI